MREPRWLKNTIRGLRKARFEHEQAEMTTAEIDDRLIDAILKAQTERGCVSRADLLRTNVPPASIDARFKLCLAVAKDRAPELFKQFSDA